MTDHGHDPSSDTTPNGSATVDLYAKQVFTTGEAAEVCKVSQQTIIRCFDAGRLGGFRVPGSRFRRIPRDELIKFMRDNGIPVENLEGGKSRILVVDDDPEILELFRDILADDDRYEVRTAATGYDAGIVTEQFRPHLIVLDYMLPDINGNKVCETIRQNGELNNTRIIVVSGVVNREEVDDLLRSGADEFIKKPFNVDHLVKRIESLLDA
ncbi:MAG: response regulator [Planctomycetota bacterium]